MSNHRTITSLFMFIFLAATWSGGCRKGPVLNDSTKHQVAAKEAIAKGDTETALRELDASIAAEPTAWAFLDRAKLKHEKGEDPPAISDCEEALKLEPDNTEVQWFLAELKKPKTNQFKGSGAVPPSASK